MCVFYVSFFGLLNKSNPSYLIGGCVVPCNSNFEWFEDVVLKTCLLPKNYICEINKLREQEADFWILASFLPHPTL